MSLLWSFYIDRLKFLATDILLFQSIQKIMQSQRMKQNSHSPSGAKYL